MRVFVAGLKFTISFDEATLVGSDRFLTLNVHHSTALLGKSRVAALGVIRVTEKAESKHLQELIRRRLESVNLQTSDLVAATTDGASNVSLAVQLLGLRQQKCFAHALDLVVRKVVFDENGSFDVEILAPEEVEREDNDTGDEVDEVEEDGPEEFGGEDDDLASITLGAALGRLRSIARSFRKRPVLMDELRKTTKRADYNGKSLKAVLDCKTRWNSTLLMIERALRILPAMNYVLARHGTPIGTADSLALERIVEILAPFKRAIKLLCDADANLSHADKVFRLLIRDLECSVSPLAVRLLDYLEDEMTKRRTIFSTVLAILDNPSYDFYIETRIGSRIPSDEDVLEILAELTDAAESEPLADEQEESSMVSVHFGHITESRVLRSVVK